MERKSRVSIVDRLMSFGVAGFIFAVLAWLLFVNFTADDEREVVEAHDAEKIATIAANTVSSQDIQKQRDEILKNQREREELQKKRQADAQKKLDDIKEKQLKEKELLEKLKQKKLDEEKAISLANKKKLEEKKKEEERKKRELAKKKAAEKKRLEDKKRKEALAAAEKARKREFESELESELSSERAARKTTTLVNRYAALITEKLQANFISPVGATKDSSALVNMRLDESGNVLDSKIVKSSGNFSYDQAVLAAVGKSSPLPLPSGEDASVLSALKTLKNINLRADF